MEYKVSFKDIVKPLLELLDKVQQRIAVLVLVFLGCIAFFIGNRFLPESSTPSSWVPVLFFGISTSIFASVIFALAYTWIAESHHVAVVCSKVSEEVAEKIQATVKDIEQTFETSMLRVNSETLFKLREMEEEHYEAIVNHFRQTSLFQYFSATDRRDVKFRAFMESALRQSRVYRFKGVAGMYVPTRIRGMIQYHANPTCEVLLVNPKRDDLLRLYARDRAASAETNLENVDERIEFFKRATYLTIVELFDLAKVNTSVKIGIYDGPVFYRTEIFDEDVLVCYFAINQQNKYPAACIYPKTTFFYDAFVTDFTQAFETMPTRSVRFNAHSNEELLSDFLDNIGCEKTRPENAVSSLRNEANANTLEAQKFYKQSSGGRRA